MLPYLLFISFIASVFSYNPSCIYCKHFIPNKNINTDLGLCKMFQETTYSSGYIRLYNFAKHCRNDENLCGKSGFLYEPINSNENKLNKVSDEDAKFFKKIDETEQLEKEFFDIMQKIKKHNKKQVYNTTKDLYKLFKRDNK